MFSTKVLHNNKLRSHHQNKNKALISRFLGEKLVIRGLVTRIYVSLAVPLYVSVRRRENLVSQVCSLLSSGWRSDCAPAVGQHSPLTTVGIFSPTALALPGPGVGGRSIFSSVTSPAWLPADINNHYRTVIWYFWNIYTTTLTDDGLERSDFVLSVFCCSSSAKKIFPRELECRVVSPLMFPGIFTLNKVTIKFITQVSGECI